MDASKLQAGDVFAEMSEQEYNKLTFKERGKVRRVTAERYLGECSAHRDRFHLRTSAGDWCIPHVSPVTVLGLRGAQARKGKAA